MYHTFFVALPFSRRSRRTLFSAFTAGKQTVAGLLTHPSADNTFPNQRPVVCRCQHANWQKGKYSSRACWGLTPHSLFISC